MYWRLIRVNRAVRLLLALAMLAGCHSPQLGQPAADDATSGVWRPRKHGAAARRPQAAPRVGWVPGAPRGEAVYAMLVDTGSFQEYSLNDGRYDLFSARIPGATTRLLPPTGRETPSSLGRAIREPQFSPDGRYVAFYANRADLPAGERLAIGWYQNPHGLLDIWLKDLERGTVSQLTQGENGWYNLAWAPAGERLCATYLRRTQPADSPMPCDLVVIGARTRTQRRVATLPDWPLALSWTRDGRAILVQTRDGLYTVPQGGGKLERLVSAPVFRSDLALSPDGRQVAYVEGHRLRLVGTKPRTPGREVILRGPRPSSGEIQDWCAVAWSSDGRRAAVADVAHDNRLGTVRTVFHVVDAASGADHPLGPVALEAAANRSPPCLWWSRNGQWLIVRYYQTMYEGRDWLGAIRVSDGRMVVLAAPSGRTHGLDWHECRPGR